MTLSLCNIYCDVVSIVLPVNLFGITLLTLIECHVLYLELQMLRILYCIYTGVPKLVILWCLHYTDNNYLILYLCTTV